jgi:hypothetical protein
MEVYFSQLSTETVMELQSPDFPALSQIGLLPLTILGNWAKRNCEMWDKGKTLAFLQGELRTIDGQLVATATAHIQTRK